MLTSDQACEGNNIFKSSPCIVTQCAPRVSTPSACTTHTARTLQHCTMHANAAPGVSDSIDGHDARGVHTEVAQQCRDEIAPTPRPRRAHAARCRALTCSSAELEKMVQDARADTAHTVAPCVARTAPSRCQQGLLSPSVDLLGRGQAHTSSSVGTLCWRRSLRRFTHTAKNVAYKDTSPVRIQLVRRRQYVLVAMPHLA